jgi:exosortase/archaeosortase family protein
MDKEIKSIVEIFSRYLLIIVLGLGNLYLFYKFLTPITISILDSILSLSGESLVIGNSIHFKRVIFEIIPACIAGSAFYLMFILVFSTREIEFRKRLTVLLSSFVLLFFFNMSRLVFLVSIVRASYFEAVHWFLWNFVSVIFVVGIWVLMVYLFRLKTIPIYSDLKYLFDLIDSGKKSKGR